VSTPIAAESREEFRHIGTVNQAALFHPAVAAWFERNFAAPTPAQQQAWPAIKAGRHTLIAAPTGSGKTLAAFFAAIDDLVRQGLEGRLSDATQVVYVSPLKALSNDIQRNLAAPLAGIRAELRRRGLPDIDIRTWVRTGDTPQADRARARRSPPHIVVTTPESLYILLGSASGRKILATTRTVIVDEIHALAPNKRGAHLAVSLERLEALCAAPLLRIGLSATQKPIERVARFLIGARALVRRDDPLTRPLPLAGGEEGRPETAVGPSCAIIDTGHTRARDLAIEVPDAPLEAVMSAEVWAQLYDHLAALIAAHRTTLIFVNTRRLAERVTRQLSERIGEAHVTAHHGSLAKEQRFDAEQRLKSGALKALVATASLELGIDIGEVDLVCQLGSPRSIASFLQRVGRSGHAVGGTPKGRLFPLSRDELVECAALLDAVRRGELDRLGLPEQPLDVLAQQIVAEVAARDCGEDELLSLVRRAWPFRDLPREDYLAVLKMLAEGFATARGRRGALIHRDAVNHVLRGRRGARLTALTSGGTIPDTADYQVLLEPENMLIGTVNEDFAVESLAGDIFQLGNTSYRIIRIERGVVRVEDAHGQPPNIPFWLGEAPGRSEELSHSVSRLRSEIEARLANRAGVQGALAWLTEEVGLAEPAAAQIVEYLAAARAALGVLPTQAAIVFERFFDEAGGMQLVIHAPFGSRLNRAWGLSLRKRFCRKFNFELQAAATEDNIVLSLTSVHSFDLSEVARYLHSASVRQVLIQALLDAPMFTTRWRWVAGVALALPRFRGGKKVPPQIARMEAEDLVAAVFPDQLACVENLAGEREIPDHPLVRQSIADCLTEAMDVAGLERLLARIESGAVRVLACDLTEPSPLAAEVLSARPYAYLDDAPLEERRTQAVMSRRWLAPEDAADLGRLDAAAITRVRAEAWPDAANADELADALAWLGFLTETEAAAVPGWTEWLHALAGQDRAARIAGKHLWIAAERLPQFRAIWPNARIEPAIEPSAETAKPWSVEGALVEVLRGRLEGLGPVTERALTAPLGLAEADAAAALAALQSEGFALRGRFTPDAAAEEWCERRLLARIHRYTVKRLRAEIEPVAARDFLRFLLAWQRVSPDERLEGPDAVGLAIAQLEGFEAAAGAWESDILPARIADYDPAWLDDGCLSGRIAWAKLARGSAGRRAVERPAEGRLSPRLARTNAERGPTPVRTTPITLLARRNLPFWTALSPPPDAAAPSPRAQAVLDAIRARGASFFDELVETSGLLRTQVEEALGELVAFGLVASDGFGGLRGLLIPSDQRKPYGGGRRRRRILGNGMADAGRWALARCAPPQANPAIEHAAIEHAAGVLLRRYGVVFWRLLEREADWLPPWRDLLRVWRRLEARGDIRGGRFVAGFSGEQYALPEAIGLLRETRRKPETGALVSLSAADPLNLVGLVTPGPRLAALAGNRVLYRDGLPVAVFAGGDVRFLEELAPAARWQARKALLRGAVPGPAATKPGMVPSRPLADFSTHSVEKVV
jgi:ATP-dependent Lhr-like helicase